MSTVDAHEPDGVPSGGQHASGSGTVVQAGRDVVLTVEQHVHPAGWSASTSRRRRRARQAFLVTSAFHQKYWLAELVRRLHRTLDRAGIDLVLKLPDRDFDAAAQAHLLRRVLAARADYVGGFVVATEIDRPGTGLAEFCAELGRPVVFTDVEPFGSDHHYPANAVFVGYSSAELGALAGHRLAAHLARVRRPRVLVAAGRAHPDRQDRCALVLRESLPDVEITVEDGCAFDRLRAYETVRAHLRTGPRFDAVFCTNDEMALGAVDALRTADAADTVVVGVDGTPEARALIDSGTGPLRATVVQDAHHLAESTVHALERMRERRDTPKRTFLRAEVYPTVRP